MTARPTLSRLLLLVGDLLALIAAIAIAVVLRWWFGGQYDPAFYLRLWTVPPLFTFLWASAGLYALLPPSPSDEMKRLVQATTLGFVVLGAITFVFRHAEQFSRGAFFIAWILALLLVPLTRVLVRAWFSRRSWWGSPVLVMGAGSTGAIVIRSLLRNPGLGLRPVAVVDDDPAKTGSACEGVPVLGLVDDAPRHAEAVGARCAILAMPGAPKERLLQLWRDLGPQFPHLVVVPGLYGFASLWVQAKDIGGVLGLEVQQSLLMAGPRLVKRILDLVLVGIAAPFVGLVMLVLALLVKLNSRGPVFYGQRRLGQGGREFTAWKFRTMRRDADAVLKDCLERDPALKAEWERDHKLRHDPRVTGIGRLLRKTSLDELPQLFNVLVGEMSLVGPRPITTAEIPKYGDHFALYTRVTPGITGLWQISGRNNTTYGERVSFDAYYVRNWSPWLDLYILARTVKTVLLGEGAY